MTPGFAVRRVGWRTIALVLGTVLLAWGEDVLRIDDFEEGLRPGWEEKSFQGSTAYSVVEENGDRVLRAESHDAASGLVYRIEVDPETYPILSWRWKIEGTLEGGDARRKSGDDYAARVYVIFPHWLPTRTRVLNYIWANRLEQGEHVPNPYLSQAIMFAVRSGDALAGTWVEERRNLMEDFRRAFGEAPPQIGGVAVMTDTDQTGETAVAHYDDIRLSAPQASEPPAGDGAEGTNP